MREYTFDLKIQARVSVNAKTEEEARTMLADLFANADANFGAWPNGDPALGSCSGFVDKPHLDGERDREHSYEA